MAYSNAQARTPVERLSGVLGGPATTVGVFVGATLLLVAVTLQLAVSAGLASRLVAIWAGMTGIWAAAVLLLTAAGRLVVQVRRT